MGELVKNSLAFVDKRESVSPAAEFARLTTMIEKVEQPFWVASSLFQKAHFFSQSKVLTHPLVPESLIALVA